MIRVDYSENTQVDGTVHPSLLGSLQHVTAEVSTQDVNTVDHEAARVLLSTDDCFFFKTVMPETNKKTG